MSWDDYYRRRDALTATLELARRDPVGPLPFAEVPGVAEVFTGPAELLQALHYRWSLKLTGRLGVALAEAGREPDADLVDVVVTGWHRTAAEHPVLRQVLDAHADDFDGALHPAARSEQRMLALAAGLAEPGEPTEEITRIGAALLALVRSTPNPVDRLTRRHRHPVEQFLRRLVASA